jgi:excisionase family DNA binding protein
MPLSDRLLTVAEVSERLAVTTKTVRRWIDEGRLEALSVGPTERVRIRESDIAPRRRGDPSVES